MSDYDIKVTRDAASKSLSAARQALQDKRMHEQIGEYCADWTANHLNALPPNKMGWPSQGFYAACAKGVAFTWTNNKTTVTVDHPEIPGALKHQFYGGTINMKDRLLTIPARQEFYGQRASSIQGLKFVMFRSGAKALVVGDEGANKFNWKTGRFRGIKGAGVRSQAMVAYWLKESVDQDAKPGVLPTPEEYAQVAEEAVLNFFDEQTGKSN